MAMRHFTESPLVFRHFVNDKYKNSVDCPSSILHSYAPSSRDMCLPRLSCISWIVYGSCTSDYNYVIKLNGMQIDEM